MSGPLPIKSLRRFMAGKLPEPVRIVLYGQLMLLKDARLSLVPVRYKSSMDTIFHCCVQRTASQWTKAVLSSPTVYEYCGLKPYDARVLGVAGNSYTSEALRRSFPSRRIVSALYIDYRQFNLIPKQMSYRAFFVMRDPRDIVVSHYFASRYSHAPIGDIPGRRQILAGLSVEDGLIYTINYLKEYGLFDALYSWYEAANVCNAHIVIVRYEDLVGPNQLEVFQRLFAHCDIGMPYEEIRKLLRKYAFERFSGHKRGELNKWSHYRKGQPRDWPNYFTPKVQQAFNSVTGGLVTYLGYGE